MITGNYYNNRNANLLLIDCSFRKILHERYSMNKWISSLPASKHDLKRLPMEKKKAHLCIERMGRGDSGQEGEEGMKGTFCQALLRLCFT